MSFLLLSTEFQTLAIDVESAFMQFQKAVCDGKSNKVTELKTFEPFILQDMETLFKHQVDIEETLIREYDLLHAFDNLLRDPKKSSTEKSQSKSLRNIGMAKQKLIFYMSYVKCYFKEAFGGDSLQNEINNFKLSYAKV